MDGQRADVIFTDPPYGVDYSGGTQFKKNGKVEKNHRDKLINDDSAEIYDRSVPIMAEFADGPVYTWFGSSKAINIFQSVALVGEIHSIIVWVKNGGSGDLNSNYKQKHEMCMYWKPKGGKLNFIGANNETNVWNIDKDGRNEYHPTQKPVSLGVKAIRNHSGKNVLDLFLGSGSTLIACEQTNRICYGMELDPKYVDVIRKRYWKFTHDNIEDGWIDGTPAISGGAVENGT
jgi:DNA modification methylase